MKQAQNNHCPVCCGTKQHYLFSQEGQRFVQCCDCRLAFAESALIDYPTALYHDAPKKTLLVVHGTSHLSHAERSKPTPASLQSCRVEGICFSREPRKLLTSIFDMLKVGGNLEITLPKTHSENMVSRMEWRQLCSLLWQCGYTKINRRDQLGSWVISAEKRDAEPKSPSLSIIVPVLNEAPHIFTSLPALLNKQFPVPREVIVVESGSTDGSHEFVKQLEEKGLIRAIYQSKAQGKGYAVREGLKVSKGNILAIQDADNEYDLEDYEPLLEPILGLREAFVLGARHGGKNLLKMRSFSHQPVMGSLLNFGHVFFCSLVNVLFRQKLRDPFTMYKIFRRDCIEGTEFQCCRFDFDFELLIKIIQKGYQPVEIPVNYRSRSFHEGKKVRMIRDPLTWLRALTLLKLKKL
jgi:hypothetical protein